MLNLIPLLVFLVLLAAAFKVSFVFHLLYLLVGVYLLSRLWSRWALRSVKLQHLAEPFALLGDRLEVQLSLYNSGLLPVPWLNVYDRLPSRLISRPYYTRTLSLLPLERVSFAIALYCRHRGYYRLGPALLRSGDLFGFEERERALEEATFLTVYPRIIALEKLGFPSRMPFGHLPTRQRIYEDPSRVVGVRDYQVGDSLRKVNWKASARIGRLQVRKYEPAITLDTVILLNLNAREYDPHRLDYSTEMGITVAASLASHLSSLRQQVGLITDGRDAAEEGTEAEIVGMPARKGQGHLMRLLQLLARLEYVERQRHFAQVVQEVSRHLAWGATLVFIAPRETEELLDISFSLRRAGFHVVLIFVDDPDRSPASLRSLGMGFPSYVIWREEDFNVWRRQQREAVV